MGRLQISVGDLSELLRPALFVLTALASACVLADARRRVHAYAAAAWTLLALFLPAIVLPLYLAARLLKRRDRPRDTTTSADDNNTTSTDGESVDTPTTLDVETPNASDVATSQASDSETPTATDGETDDSPSTLARARARARAALESSALKLKRAALPLAYLFAVLLVGALYFYLDYASFDAHFTRARQAKLYNQPERTISELRAALRLREDAHTRKLLGMELAEAGRWEEALAELRAAARGGEPDDRLVFREALALETLNRTAEAADAYRRFLQTRLCARPEPDPLCADARARLKDFGF